MFLQRKNKADDKTMNVLSIVSSFSVVLRDTFHLILGLGRYTVGLLLTAMLTGNSVQGNTF